MDSSDGKSGNQNGAAQVDKNQDCVNDVDREGDTIDDREGRLLLRPTDSSDIARLGGPRSRSNSKNATNLRQPLPVLRSVSTQSGDLGRTTITDSEINSSQFSSSISDINSFDDGASIASRLSQIVIEQEDILKQYRKSLDCLPQSTSCYGASLSPDSSKHRECKRRLSLNVPNFVRGSLKNLAAGVSSSISNLSTSSYDRDIEATMRRVRSSATCRRRSSGNIGHSLNEPVTSIQDAEDLESNGDHLPKIEILHDADAHIVTRAPMSNGSLETRQTNGQTELDGAQQKEQFGMETEQEDKCGSASSNGIDPLVIAEMKRPDERLDNWPSEHQKGNGSEPNSDASIKSRRHRAWNQCCNCFI